jgi:hypothetical protein
MGWREAIGDRFTADALLGLSQSDRIALARELLAGTGRVVARDVGVMAYADDLDPAINGHCDGWNACRTAMLGGDDA